MCASKYKVVVERQASGEFIAFSRELGMGACCGLGSCVESAKADYVENEKAYLYQLSSPECVAYTPDINWDKSGTPTLH